MTTVRELLGELQGVKIFAETECLLSEKDIYEAYSKVKGAGIIFNRLMKDRLVKACEEE